MEYIKTIGYKGEKNPSGEGYTASGIHSPVLKDEILNSTNRILQEEHYELSTKEIPDNSKIGTETFEDDKIKLKIALDKLYQKNNDAPIIFIRTGCFTNDSLEITLNEILGEENFKKFVKIGDISLLERKEKPKNSIILFGGDYSDVYENGNVIFTEGAKEIMRDTLSESITNYNLRLFGVCHGAQFLADLVGMIKKNSSNVIATAKGAAEILLSAIKIKPLENLHPIYTKMFSDIEKFSAYMTRTGYIQDNLLGSNKKDNSTIIAIAIDLLTNSIAIFGNNGGRILGIQPHIELNLERDKKRITEEIKHLKYILKEDYGEEIKDIHKNFDFAINHVKKEIGAPVFSRILLSFSEDILKTSKKTEFQENSEEMKEKSFDEITHQIRRYIMHNLKKLSQSSNKCNFIKLDQQSKNYRDKIIKNSIDAGVLKLNNELDWLINRTPENISEILGVKDIKNFVEGNYKYKNKTGKENFIFVDKGAGGGGNIKNMYESDLLKGKNIIYYGIGDKIYFDLYEGLTANQSLKNIPNEILNIFNQETKKNYNLLTKYDKGELNYNEKLLTIKSASRVKTSDLKGLEDLNGNFTEINKKSIDYIKNNPHILEDINFEIRENFNELIQGYIERIYVSDFNQFNLSRQVSKADFQIAIRSTSHLSNEDFKDNIIKFLQSFSKEGSIFLENGVHQSYTGTPRIHELFEIQELFKKEYGIKINLIYDKKTNYFSQAIIERDLDGDFYFSEKNENELLDDNHISISLDEANESSYFNMEIFIRDFIANCFKDHSVFWDFNRSIIDITKYSTENFDNKKMIKLNITNLINDIVESENHDNGKKYNTIEIEDLEKFQSIHGKTIDGILDKGLIIHNWLNKKTERNY